MKNQKTENKINRLWACKDPEVFEALIKFMRGDNDD